VLIVIDALLLWPITYLGVAIIKDCPTRYNHDQIFFALLASKKQKNYAVKYANNIAQKSAPK
jgi:hypothetical protein